MQKIRERWEIQENWQFIYIILGITGLIACGFYLAFRLLPSKFEDVLYEYLFMIVVTAISAYIIYRICMWLFVKLQSRWDVTYRWELIAIFLVFAVTGSASAKVSGPVLEWIGVTRETVNPWIFWPIRLLIIFPFYQILLVLMGWLFGQFEFFWDFEKKMLSRFGIKI